jgi:iron(III) transport system permease protein
MQGFFRVSLPLARPFIVAGTGLVVRECLADFGTVKLYNYTTFTTARYQAWFGLFSLQSALQLSLVLISIVMVALLLGRRLRGKARYTADGSASFRQRIRLSGRGALLASTLCSAIFIVAFAAPALLIASWSVRSFAGEFDVRYWTFAGNSLKLAAMAAGLIVLLGLLLAYAARAHHGAINQVLTRLATAGYAIPGAVLAVGFFVPVAMLSRSLTNLSGGIAVSLQSGLLVILLAYAARYLAVAHGPIDSALLRINPNVEDASRGLGITGTALLRRLHLPVVRPALWTAALLVFVDVMKELPITLMTRPYGWDTLAVRVFQLTTEGEWERAALPSLAIVLAGVVPVILLTRQRDHA